MTNGWIGVGLDERLRTTINGGEPSTSVNRSR